MDDFFIEPEYLLSRLVTSAAPDLIDVRRAPAYQAADRILPGARWRDHAKVHEWAETIPACHPTIVYCVHGEQVSQSAVSVLRARGLPVRALRHGFEGWFEVGGLTVRRLPEDEGAAGLVLPLQPAPADLAAAWIIRRFIDRQAGIHFVERIQVDAASIELNARICDAAGLLVRYGLADGTLNRLVAIAEDADDNRSATLPETAGISLVMQGLNDLAGSEHEMLQQSFAIFDAVYAGLSSAERKAMR